MIFSVSFTYQSLYIWGNIPWYALHRRLHGPQKQLGCGGEEKNPPPAGNQIPAIHSFISLTESVLCGTYSFQVPWFYLNVFQNVILKNCSVTESGDCESCAWVTIQYSSGIIVCKPSSVVLLQIRGGQMYSFGHSKAISIKIKEQNNSLKCLEQVLNSFLSKHINFHVY